MDYEEKLKHLCQREGFDVETMKCPGCRYDVLTLDGVEPALAAKTAYHEYVGLPVDDLAREHYLNGFFEMTIKKQTKEKKPIVVFVAEDSLTRDEFDELWFDLWNFCECGKPEFVLEFIRDVLTHLDEIPECLEEHKYEEAFEHLNQYKKLIHLNSSQGLSHLSLYALTTMGLITHRKNLVESILTPQGKLFLNFLQREDIDTLFAKN